MRLTAASDSTSASSVGMTIQDRLRFSACPIARRSRSPKSDGAGFGAATGFGAGAATVDAEDLAFSAGTPLPERKNGIRMAHSYGRLRLHSMRAITLH